MLGKENVELVVGITCDSFLLLLVLAIPNVVGLIDDRNSSVCESFNLKYPVWRVNSLSRIFDFTEFA